MKIDSSDVLTKLVKGSKVSESGGKVIWQAPEHGGMIDGRDQKGDGGQGEKQEPLLVIRIPLVFQGSISSPWFFVNNKDGIRFDKNSEGSEMRFCRFLNAGEDCVNTRFGNLLIRDSYFQGWMEKSDPEFDKLKNIYLAKYNKKDADKCLQLNNANNCEIVNCDFDRFITGIVFGNSNHARKKDVATIRSCDFWNVETAMRANKTQIKETKNTFHNVKHPRMTEGGGKFF